MGFMWNQTVVAAVRNQGYAVLIEQENGGFILYEDMVEKTAEGKLMISANLLGERVPRMQMYLKNKLKVDLVLHYGEQKNGYTLREADILIKKGREEVFKTAKQAPYLSEKTGNLMISSHLEGLFPYRYVSQPEEAFYESYQGVLLYGASVKETEELPRKGEVEVIKTNPLHSCLDTVISPYSSQPLSSSQIKEKTKKYGTITMPGFSREECEDIYSKEWIDATEYDKTPSVVTVDIAKQYPYESYTSALKKLSRFEGVYLYEIGKTTMGRPMYSIVVDMESNQEKKTLLFTGTTHSREGAGGVFLLKQFADMIAKAQTDQSVMNLLKKYTYVAVPIISADVREELINGNSKFISNGQFFKAYANGVDGNRNYPGINCGMLLNGISKSSIIESNPGYGNFPGYSAASNAETKAMMKWLYHYIVCEQAVFLADYHQQGHLIYGGKPYDQKDRETDFKRVAEKLCSFLNRGNGGGYYWIYEGANYGLNGMGSTLTDYAMSCALGAKYSTAYGNFVILDESSGKERILMEYRDLDQFPGNFRIANPNFRMVTFEVASGVDKLGYSANTRSLLKREYTLYHYDQLFTYLPSIL